MMDTSFDWEDPIFVARISLPLRLGSDSLFEKFLKFCRFPEVFQRNKVQL